MGLHSTIASHLTWHDRVDKPNSDDLRVAILKYEPDDMTSIEIGFVAKNPRLGKYWWCTTARSIRCVHTVTEAHSKRTCVKELEHHAISEIYRLVKERNKHGKRRRSAQ